VGDLSKYGALFGKGIIGLETQVRKYVIVDETYEMFISLNLPMTPEQIRKIYIENQEYLKFLFSTLLSLDKSNLYGNFGMFKMESYTGKNDSAIEYATIGISNNPNLHDVCALRTSLAEVHEDMSNYRDANELYIDNINSALTKMQSRINAFQNEYSTKLMFSQPVAVKIVEDSKKSPIGTYIFSETLPFWTQRTQCETERAEFEKLKMIHETKNYQMANSSLSDLDDAFVHYDKYLHEGLQDLRSRVDRTFQEKIFSTHTDRLYTGTEVLIEKPDSAFKERIYTKLKEINN
jgi:hypothetical protein